MYYLEMTHYEQASELLEQINENIRKRRRYKAIAIPCAIVGGLAAIILISIYFLKENAEIFYLILGVFGVVIFLVGVVFAFIIGILGSRNDKMRYQIVVETREMEKERLREGNIIEN